MRWWLVLAICFIPWGLQADIRPQHSGAWFNVDQSGHGLSIQVLDDQRAIAFWYAYTPEGEPMFLVIDGIHDHHTVTGTAYYQEGMVWGAFDPATLHQEVWGVVSVEFLDCNQALLTWSSNDPAYGEGQVELERLAFVALLGCEDVSDEVTGEWQVQVMDADARPWPDGGPWIANVAPNGEIGFVDGQDCEWEGHIHIQSLARGWMTGEFGKPHCADPIPVSFAFGQFYPNGVTFCNSGGGCVDYDQAMTLTIDRDIAIDGGITLRLLR